MSFFLIQYLNSIFHKYNRYLSVDQMSSSSSSSGYLNSPDTDDSDKEGGGEGNKTASTSSKSKSKSPPAAISAKGGEGEGEEGTVFTAADGNSSSSSSAVLSKEEVLATCLSLKTVGNEHFGKAEYELALAKYTEAVNLLKKSELPKDPLILLNRSATFLALKRYVPAMSDASQVCDTDPDNWKAHWRRGMALMGMVQKKFRTKEAVEAFEECLKCSTLPANKKSEVTNELAKVIKSKESILYCLCLDVLYPLVTIGELFHCCFFAINFLLSIFFLKFSPQAQRRLQKQDDETPPADLSNCAPS